MTRPEPSKDSLTRRASAPGASLELATEKPEIYRGELVSLQVTLTPTGERQVEYEGPESLSPLSGRLRLYLGDNEDRLRTLYPPIFSERLREVHWQSLTEPVSLDGIGTWLGALEAGITKPGFYWIRAEYLGTDGEDISSSRIELRFVEVPADQPEEKLAQEAFLLPEIARFVFLQGGPISEGGRRRLEEIARSDAPVFGPLADLTLANADHAASSLSGELDREASLRRFDRLSIPGRLRHLAAHQRERVGWLLGEFLSSGPREEVDDWQLRRLEVLRPPTSE